MVSRYLALEVAGLVKSSIFALARLHEWLCDFAAR